jgi:hypothetical protein
MPNQGPLFSPARSRAFSAQLLRRAGSAAALHPGSRLPRSGWPLRARDPAGMTRGKQLVVLSGRRERVFKGTGDDMALKRKTSTEVIGNDLKIFARRASYGSRWQWLSAPATTRSMR